MIVKKIWKLNEKTGDTYSSVTVIDEEENNLDFCVDFYRKIGYSPMGKKYCDFDEVMYKPLDWDHTEFLGLILK